MTVNNQKIDVTQATGETIGPFTEILQGIGSASISNLSENIPRDLHFDVLAMTLLIAIFLWWRRSGRGAKGADSIFAKLLIFGGGFSPQNKTINNELITL